MSARDRDWARLRALPVDAVLAALGVERRSGALICPKCGSLFEANDDPSYGVSIRCRNEHCRLGQWVWPEHALADLLGHVKLGEAQQYLFYAAEVLSKCQGEGRAVS